MTLRLRDITLGIKIYHLVFVFILLVKSAQSIFGKHKVSLVRVVFYWSSQNDVAVLQGRDIGTFNKRSLILILVQKVVPKVVL